MIALSTAAIIYSTPIADNFKTLKCAILLFLNEANYGVDSTYSTGSWGGITGVMNTASQAIGNMESRKDIFESISNNRIGSGDYAASLSALEALTTDYDESNSNAYLVPDPLDGTATFILELRKNFKSYNVGTSQSFPLFQQRAIYKDIIFPNMMSLQNIADDITKNSALSSATSGISELGSFQTTINDFKKLINDNLDMVGDYMDYVKLGYALYFAAFLGLTCLIIVGIFGMSCCKCIKCRCCIHIGWIIFYFLMLIGLILSTVFFPLSIVLSEACEIISLDSLNSGAIDIDADIWKQVKICLNPADGDLYTKFNLEDSIGFAKKALNNLDVINQVYKNGELTYDILNSYLSTVFLYSIFTP